MQRAGGGRARGYIRTGSGAWEDDERAGRVRACLERDVALSCASIYRVYIYSMLSRLCAARATVAYTISVLALAVLTTMAGCAVVARPGHQQEGMQATVTTTTTSTPPAKKRMNIMLITVDDLRPEIGAFHPWSPHDTILTPHLDRLAGQGTLFTNAVVTFALCGPSRTSFLTSLRPDTTKVWTIGPFFRNLTGRGDSAVTLPQAFKNAGWHTESYGKVFHVSSGCYRRPIITGGPPNGKGSTAGCLNDPVSWSIPAWLPDPYAERGTKEIAKGRNPTGPMNPSMLSWEAVDAPDEEFPDGNISAHANAALTRMKSTVVDEGRNFFLAVGFLKPHLPQVFPRKYLDLYAGVPMPRVASNPFPPTGSPFMAWGGVMQEISEYSNIISAKGSNKTQASYDLPTTVQVRQKRGYHAASTYIDAQIGQLLGTLDSLDLRDSTIVAVIGDHGWKLGAERHASIMHLALQRSIESFLFVHMNPRYRKLLCKSVS